MTQLMYNSNYHSAIKITPAEALFDFNPDIQSNVNNLKKSIMYDVAGCVEDLHVM